GRGEPRDVEPLPARPQGGRRPSLRHLHGLPFGLISGRIGVFGTTGGLCGDYAPVMPDYRMRRLALRIGLSVLLTTLSVATPSVASAAKARSIRPPAVAPRASARPNILLINTDDQRWDTLSFLPKTMNWMSNARNFDRFQVAIPSCCPSRADLFSGRYP